MKLSFFILSAKIFHVIIQCLTNYANSAVSTLYITGHGLLAFKSLINGEEMSHFIKGMAGKLHNILDLVIDGICEGYADYLLIPLSAIQHGNKTYWIASDKGKRLQHLGTDNENIKRVSVIAVGTGNKTVVSGIMGGSIKNAVKDNKSGLLIQLVLLLAALANLDNSDKIFGIYALGVNVMPYIHTFTSFPEI